MTKPVSHASHPASREACERVLAAQGSAVDAVVAAYFALAGQHEAALFAPLTALVAGPAALGRAFDGRVVQPGAGLPRPRGFVGEVPDAALAAVPRAPQAALLMHASFGRSSLRDLIRPGLADARAVSPKRALFLERFGDVGALALSSVHDASFRVAGPLASGLLSDADWSNARALDVEAHLVHGRGATGESFRVALEPWASEGGVSLAAEVVVAVDVRGLIAALALFVPRVLPALVIPEVEVALPPLAAPVLRGRPRVPPGSPVVTRRALLTLDAGGELGLAAAWPDGFSPPDAAGLATSLAERPIERALHGLAAGARVLAAVGGEATGRALSLEPSP